MLQPSHVSSESAAQELNHRCPYCDRLLVPRVETYKLLDKERSMFVWPDRCGCQAEAEALGNQRIEAELSAAQIREQVRLAHLQQAGLVGWLAQTDFEQFQLREDWPGAMDCKARVLAYFDRLEADGFETVNHPVFKPHKKNWLILHGHYGNGKTLLAAAMVKWYTGPGSAYFRVWSDYERRIRDTYNNPEAKETESTIIQELQQGAFVVIDDLDKKKATEFTRGVLFAVLNYRYNSELPTVLTFNYGPNEIDPKAPGRLALEEYLGTAVLDRILGSAFDVVEFDGPSYRSGVKW